LLNDDELNYVLPLFLAEVVKQDGSHYPPATLRQLVVALQKHLEIIGCPRKLLVDDKFKSIQNALDMVMKRSAAKGTGLEHRQATVISEAMEDVLWERGLLGDQDGQTLLNTMVYVLGLHFALRGRDEHRRLRHKPSQICVKVSEDGRRYLEYREVCDLVCLHSCVVSRVVNIIIIAVVIMSELVVYKMCVFT